MNLAMKTYNNLDLNGMQKFASELANSLQVGDVICLYGDLGAGKTTLTQMLVNSLTDKHIDVTSPTFNLVHTYETKLGTIWHFDLYRLENPNDLYNLGLEDAFNNGISIIEWPQIAESILPDNIIQINISPSDNEKRNISLKTKKVN
jgi:tRNA threonylcarbamoyl adenosine modification protein YjeE